MNCEYSSRYRSLFPYVTVLDIFRIRKLTTFYVVISELLNYAPSSGEIVISDKNLKVIDTLEIEY